MKEETITIRELITKPKTEWRRYYTGTNHGPQKITDVVHWTDLQLCIITNGSGGKTSGDYDTEVTTDAEKARAFAWRKFWDGEHRTTPAKNTISPFDHTKHQKLGDELIEKKLITPEEKREQEKYIEKIQQAEETEKTWET